MGFFIIILICIAMILLGRYGSRLCFNLAAHFQNKNEKEEYYKNELLKAVREIGKTEIEEENPGGSLQALIKANQELKKKKEIQDAMRDELGINI